MGIVHTARHSYIITNDLHLQVYWLTSRVFSWKKRNKEEEEWRTGGEREEERERGKEKEREEERKVGQAAIPSRTKIIVES